MPFLRFNRDKRGYETVSLVHAFRNQKGRTTQKVLYWFRTPPNVKVGRPLFDPDTVQWIEQQYPELEFDWRRILAAIPPPASAEDDLRGQRRGTRVERRAETRARKPARRAPGPKDDRGPSSAEADAEAVPVVLPQSRPDTADAPAPGGPAPQGLDRFQARYRDLLARIAERAGDPVRAAEIAARAESLNPDAWTTEDARRQGAERFEAAAGEIRAELGLPRRRRSRRGGRKRRKGLPDSQTEGDTSSSKEGAGAEAESGEGGEGVYDAAAPDVAEPDDPESGEDEADGPAGQDDGE